MRIALDGRFWSEEAAGLSRYSKELVKNLLKIDKKNEYFLFLLPKYYRKFKNQNSKIKMTYKNLTPVLIKSPHYSISEQIKMPFEIAKINFDFIHFLSFNHPVFWPGKFIITIHDLTLFFFPTRRGKTIFHQWGMKGVMKDAVERAAKIIVPSESTKKDLIKFLNPQPSKLKTIYEGVPEDFKTIPVKKISEFKKTNKLDFPYLLYIGQWRPHKNLERLVEAFEIARKKSGTRFQLVLGGKPDPNYKNLMIKIKNSPYKKDILMPGFISEKDLVLWYNAATAFVFPSLYEGFGLPPLEAMACGTPVLSSSSSSLPEVLGKAAMYFDQENVEEMAKTIARSMENGGRRTELRRKGLKQVKKFSFEKMAKETLKVYNSIK